MTPDQHPQYQPTCMRNSGMEQSQHAPSQQAQYAGRAYRPVNHNALSQIKSAESAFYFTRE